jgi:hypothetical protein
MAGIVEGRGDWEYARLPLTAASVITQGDAVALSTARTVSLYSGGQAGLLGFIKHDSADSLPAGQCVVAIPKPGCTAFIDVPTGIANSTMSRGECFGIYASGGNTSFLTTAAYSDASRVVCVVGNPIISPTSRIEVTFLSDSFQFYSNNTVALG